MIFYLRTMFTQLVTKGAQKKKFEYSQQESNLWL